MAAAVVRGDQYGEIPDDLLLPRTEANRTQTVGEVFGRPARPISNLQWSRGRTPHVRVKLFPMLSRNGPLAVSTKLTLLYLRAIFTYPAPIW